MTADVDPSTCPASFWLPGGHLQTQYSALVARHHRIAFVRQRVDTPDGDFIDVDWAAPGLFPDRLADGSVVKPDPALSHTAAHRWGRADDWQALPDGPDAQALVLFHGLEGSSRSHYAQAIAQYFRARGWVVAIAHFRSCSGFPNRMARAYHSGDAAEVGFMLSHLRKHLPLARLHGVGVSLGGNALLRLLGERQPQPTQLSACAAISVPMDLVACGDALSSTFLGRHVYCRHFLRTMRPKLMEKARRFPGAIDVLRLSQARTLRDFDDCYTAPMHGYLNALDYWTQASSLSSLRHITVPTLILNARNDPFVPEQSLPGSRDASASVLLHQPAQGGHAGFTSGAFPGHITWLPQRIARFFETRR